MPNTSMSSGSDLLKALRGKLTQLNSGTPSKSPLVSGGSLLGVYATIWLLDKFLLERARQETQTGFDQMWPTEGANLNILDL